MILNYGNNKSIPINYSNFLRPNLFSGTVHTRPTTKYYRPIVTKGIVNNDFKVINFGMSSL
jgi:hypothetical protein